MQSDTKVLRIKTGVSVLCVVIYIAGVVLLSLHLPFGISNRHRVWLVPTYAVLGVLWLADIFTRREPGHRVQVAIKRPRGPGR